MNIFIGLITLIIFGVIFIQFIVLFEKLVFIIVTFYFYGNLANGAMMNLVAYSMRQNGQLSQKELSMVKEFLKKEFPKRNTERLYRHFVRRLYNSKSSFDTVVSNLNFFYPKSKKVKVLIVLLYIAYADNEYSEKEQALLKKIAQEIGVNKVVFKIIYDSFLHKNFGFENGDNETSKKGNESDSNASTKNVFISKSQLTIAYKILGLATDATEYEVKKAYRKLVKIFHPDMNIENSEMQKEIAQQQFIKVTRAYDIIRERKAYN